MKITSVDRDRLTLWLANAIRDARVTPWGVDLREEIAEPDLSEDLKKSLDKHLDGGLVKFLRWEILKQILASDIDLPEQECDVGTALQGKDPIYLANHFVNEISLLPFEYRIVVRGPASWSYATKSIPINIQITDQMRLVSSGLLKEGINFNSKSASLDTWIWWSNQIPSKELHDKYLYFEFRCSGYLGDQFRAAVFQQFMDELRSFYGACLAHDLFFPYQWGREAVNPVVMAVNHSGGDMVHVESLDTDLVQCTHFESSGNIRYFKRERFEAFINPAVHLMKCSSPKIKTASIWFLRAKLSSMPMDKVLESAIALEVLLGDRKMSDRVGLTKLMANRYAYALASSSRERDDFISFFNDFYNLRSELVHAGRLRHTDREAEIVEKGVELASRVLVYEQSLDSGC